MTTVPAAWMPRANMKRIICHWTAGTRRANAVDKSHYHVLIEGDGKLVRGDHSIKDNERPGGAAHTLNCNTGSIGVSLCCMAGAIEQPFNAGGSPMTRKQWETLVLVLVDLCRAYGITPSRETLLSHAEVQTTLKIQQRQKWDYTRLAFDPSISGALKIGDRLRSEVKAALNAPARFADLPADADGGEPDDDSDGSDAPPPEVYAPTELTPAEIRTNKALLRAKGYTMVGETDEDMGPRTIAAIAAFQKVNGLPITNTFDEATRRSLANGGKPMAIAPARANATSADIATKVPEVASARTTSLIGKVQAWSAVAGGFVWGVKDQLAGAMKSLEPLRDAIDDIPKAVWIAAAVAIAISMAAMASRTANQASDAYRKGDRI